jgi:rare lipoprotein A
MIRIRSIRLTSLATLVVACGVGAGTLANAVVNADEGTAATVTTSHVQLDRSGRKQVGKASFYANRYSGKTMADGTPMHLYSNNAASLTLPLGTTARVTNLETGQSAVVTIRDRGPYVKGRIVDLSPATARKIGIDRRKGLAKVEVAPISVPLADGTLKFAALMSP